MKESKSFFKVKNITDLNQFTDGQELPTSDLLLHNNERVVQFEYVDEGSSDGRLTVEPGVFTMKLDKYDDIVLSEVVFNKDKIVVEYASTEKIIGVADKLFTKLDIYKKRGYHPQRATLLWGAPGQGKTSSIIAAVNKYSEEKTFTLLWPTAVFKAYHVKEFLQKLNLDAIDKLILVIEDIGGGEVEFRGSKVPVDSELLAMLDKSTELFTVPTLILATTNYPANLMEPLLRTGRFDDIMEISGPDGSQRKTLLEFFCGPELLDLLNNREALEEIVKNKYDDFSVSDLKELPLKAELEELSLLDALSALITRKELIKNEFEKNKNKNLGF